MKEGGLGGVGVEQGGEEVRVEREEKCMEASRARGAKKENGILSVKVKSGGFSIRSDHVFKCSKSENEKNPSGVYKREFVCHRAGNAKHHKVIELERKRKQKSLKCNCSAKMWIAKRKIEVQYLPAYHDIPADDHNRILLLSKVCCLVSLIIKVLELEKGIDADNLSFLEKDIKNFIQSQHSIEEENEGTEVLKLCKSLKDKDDAFQYDFTLDENNKLEHIIWVFGDSIRAYEAFGDAVIFDTTYGINRYDMPHGLWIGSFMSFVKGKCLQTILTDEDLALEEAISTEFPNTKHAFCIWHIVAKLSTWFSFPLGSRYNEFKYEFHRLYNLECAVDFENNGKNQAGEEARMRKKYHNPSIRTSFPIEEHVATILTPYAFELLQHEIELSTKYAATKTKVKCLKTKDRVEVVVKELKRIIELVKGMPEVQEDSIELEHFAPNDNECDVKNFMISKTKGCPRGSRPKGGVEVAKNSGRCHIPNYDGTNHDSQNCPNKKKNVENLSSQSSTKIAKGWKSSLKEDVHQSMDELKEYFSLFCD
ncbi:hypothetical protein GYH30_024810 [Glycine max]|uniref:Protein FAR1-RELATED SEQUENCE n=1 Tax=Glycine max TaxID=3847 RepID=K7LDF6_SOYBN|nr:hypothetical protein GYH30_024810 [Glycine max]